jgi:uncharacterized protein YpmS
MNYFRFTTTSLLRLTFAVALLVVVVRQRQEITTLRANNVAMSAACAKQKKKLNQYIEWYWDKAFDNQRGQQKQPAAECNRRRA